MAISREHKAALGTKISDYRKRLAKENRSLRKVADTCLMDHTVLDSIEKGRGFPTEDVIYKLSENLNLSDEEKCDLLNCYAQIADVAPPDIDKFLLTESGKRLWQSLRLAKNKQITEKAVFQINEILFKLEDKKDESTN